MAHVKHFNWYKRARKIWDWFVVIAWRRVCVRFWHSLYDKYLLKWWRAYSQFFIVWLVFQSPFNDAQTATAHKLWLQSTPNVKVHVSDMDDLLVAVIIHIMIAFHKRLCSGDEIARESYVLTCWPILWNDLCTGYEHMYRVFAGRGITAIFTWLMWQLLMSRQSLDTSNGNVFQVERFDRFYRCVCIENKIVT